jgi:hypothetical protein
MPQQAREKYDELMKEWWQTNPAWSSDEHEFCLWLAARHPDFFASEIPVIGYAQIRTGRNLTSHCSRLLYPA